MTLPLLAYKPSSQNQRVPGYEVGNDDTPTIYRSEEFTDAKSKDQLMWAAYRQIFSEHLILESNRQTFLESQLNNGMISVRDFLRGLAKSETFYRLVVESNSNYRIVEICLKRFLGRAHYNEQEKIAWSIVIAQKGIGGFVDALLDSEEYLTNFGETTVPFQRRRMKDRPFNLVTPRYNDYWRDREASDNPKQGDIRNFLKLAREVKPVLVKAEKVNLTYIQIPDMTRKSSDPVPASVKSSFRFPLR